MRREEVWPVRKAGRAPVREEEVERKGAYKGDVWNLELMWKIVKVDRQTYMEKDRSIDRWENR